MRLRKEHVLFIYNDNIKSRECCQGWNMRQVVRDQEHQDDQKTITYMTPNFLPTRRHRLLWCQRGPVPIPGLLRPFILGVPGPGLERPFDFGPGLDLADGLLRPEVQ